MNKHLYNNEHADMQQSAGADYDHIHRDLARNNLRIATKESEDDGFFDCVDRQMSNDTNFFNSPLDNRQVFAQLGLALKLNQATMVKKDSAPFFPNEIQSNEQYSQPTEESFYECSSEKPGQQVLEAQTEFNNRTDPRYDCQLFSDQGKQCSTLSIIDMLNESDTLYRQKARNQVRQTEPKAVQLKQEMIAATEKQEQNMIKTQLESTNKQTQSLKAKPDIKISQLVNKQQPPKMDSEFFFITTPGLQEQKYGAAGMGLQNINSDAAISGFEQKTPDDFRQLTQKTQSFNQSFSSSASGSKGNSNSLNDRSNKNGTHPEIVFDYSGHDFPHDLSYQKHQSTGGVSGVSMSKLFVNCPDIKKNASVLLQSLSSKGSFTNSTPPKSGSLVTAKEKTKLNKKSYTELNNLVLAQEVQCGEDAIWVFKFRNDGLFAASGGKEGILKIWAVTEGNESNLRQTLDPVPRKVYKNIHKSDIFDLNWCTKSSNLLLTSSSDFTVILWNITSDKPLQIYQHPDIVSAATFKIQSDKLITTGCFDKFVRVWDIKHRKVVDWQQTAAYITSIQYNPTGERLLVGLVNGDCLVYDSTKEKLQPIRSIECKNKRGKFSKGRKVTSIEFLNNSIAMVTTNDSRIRFIDIKSGKQIYKVKGHKNESFPMKASISDDHSHVICGSDDGDLYLWSQIESTVIAMSKRGVFGKLLTQDRSNSCEYFTPFGKSQSLTIAQFTPQSVIQTQMKRYLRMRSDKIINMIMVVGSLTGQLRIYHNETECSSPTSSPVKKFKM